MIFHSTTGGTTGGIANRPGTSGGSGAEIPTARTSASPATVAPTGSNTAPATSAPTTEGCQYYRPLFHHPTKKTGSPQNAQGAPVFPAPEPLPPRACGTGSRGQPPRTTGHPVPR
jgi:hypothetical protein